MLILTVIILRFICFFRYPLNDRFVVYKSWIQVVGRRGRNANPYRFYGQLCYMHFQVFLCILMRKRIEKILLLRRNNRGQ